MGAFEEMIIGSPEFRADAQSRLVTPPRWPAIWWIVLPVAVLVGGVVLGVGVASLRDAHLYRQRSREGLGFVWVGMAYLVAHALLGFATSATVRLRAGLQNECVARLLFWVGVVIVAGLALADAFGAWLWWHGDGCLGPCDDAVWPPT